jgi:RhtB (resistance to homoserine/threonine) family protein
MKTLDYAVWLTFATISFFAILTPGPDLAITIRNAVAHGRRAGVFTACGITLGLCVHVGYSITGIVILLQKSQMAFEVVKYMGAAYLCWLGWQALRSRPHDESAVDSDNSDEAAAGTAGKAAVSCGWAFRSGLMANVLNPKATLFFIAMFTQVISPEAPLWAKAVYGGTVMLEAFFIFMAVAVFMNISHVRRAYTRVAHYIERVLGVFFIGFGIKLALSKISAASPS